MRGISETYGIIGAGKVGSTLSITLAEKGRLSWVLARSENSRERISVPAKDITIISSIKEIPVVPEIIIVAVNDSNIFEVAGELAAVLDNKLEGKIIIHTAGILTKEVLSACSDKGAFIGSAHPYQTFYIPSKEILNNIAWGIEADSGEIYNKIAELIILLNGKPVWLKNITEAEKAIYHASAVAASNFMTAIISLSRELAEMAGINAAGFIPQIIKTTLENNLDFRHNEFPLTGPVARGDSEAILKHIKALECEPELKETYRYFTGALLELALRYKYIEPEKYNEIKRIMNNK